MTIRNLAALLGAVLLLTNNVSNAGVIEFTWTSTLESATPIVDATRGEVVTTIISVDNGGSGIASQVWNFEDFVSYKLIGESGWWMEAVGTVEHGEGLGGSTYWATDLLGNVTSAADWRSATAYMISSWGTSNSNRWWNNGWNYVESFGGISLNNVNENIEAASWLAAAQVEVPEPTSIVLLCSALAGICFFRKRKA